MPFRGFFIFIFILIVKQEIKKHRENMYDGDIVHAQVLTDLLVKAVVSAMPLRENLRLAMERQGVPPKLVSCCVLFMTTFGGCNFMLSASPP